MDDNNMDTMDDDNMDANMDDYTRGIDEFATWLCYKFDELLMLIINLIADILFIIFCTIVGFWAEMFKVCTRFKCIRFIMDLFNN